MASYVVMEPPSGSSELPVFVRDGFAVLGFLLPPLWLAWHRMWIEAAAALLAMVGLNLLAGQNGLAPLAVVPFFVSLYVGLEGPELRLAALRRQGWRDAAAIDADRLDDAELRYAYGREAGAV